MTDLFLMLSVPLIVLFVATIAYLIESRGRCNHKWTKWDDPENTGVNVIQRRTCEKCNLMDSRVVFANASIETCEERHDVAISTPPANTVDKETTA